MEEGVRHGSLAAVVGEVGRADMAATRRLQLAAEESGTPALLLRRWRKAGADPLAAPSAAVTRWRIACAPVCALAVRDRPHEGIGRARWRSRSSGSAAARPIDGSGGSRCRGSPRSSCPIWRSTGSGGAERRRAPEGRRRRRGDRPAAAPRPLPAKRGRPLAPGRALGAGGVGRGTLRAARRAKARWSPRSASGNRDVIAAACPAARALGLAPGMPLAKARVLVARARRPPRRSGGRCRLAGPARPVRRAPLDAARRRLGRRTGSGSISPASPICSAARS